VGGLAANDRDMRLVNLVKIDDELLIHGRHQIPACLSSDESSGRNNTRTWCPHFRRIWHRPTILRRDPGLAASPPVRYTLRVAGRDLSLPFVLSRSVELAIQEVTPVNAVSVVGALLQSTIARLR
jgi:hypothetical protein